MVPSHLDSGARIWCISWLNFATSFMWKKKYSFWSERLPGIPGTRMKSFLLCSGVAVVFLGRSQTDSVTSTDGDPSSMLTGVWGVEKNEKIYSAGSHRRQHG